MDLKKAKLEKRAKTVVAFYKHESKELFKHTVNYFEKENVPVRTIHNVVAKYRKHNLTSYLPKTGPSRKNF